MKKSILFFILTFCLINSVSSQSCLPEGSIFSNQAAINNFQADYPGCTGIEGDVTISGVNITNLNGLDVLTTIGGTLRIAHNDALTNLSGLNNLTSIGGGMQLDTNAALTNITALENLEEIGAEIRIAANAALTNLSGLNGLTSINGDLFLYHNDNLQNLLGLNNLATISGSLTIAENYQMQNLSGLDNLTTIQASLVILNQFTLLSLQNLHNLNAVGGNLTISGNYSLTSLSGLENVNPGLIDNLTISQNSYLTDCEVAWLCDFLSNPAGSINIYANGDGCAKPTEIANSCGIILSCLPYGNYYLSQWDIDDFQEDFPGCCNLNGNVYISGEDLQELNCITSIEGNLTIESPNILSFNGLGNLNSIGRDFNILHTSYLTNMIGLDNLKSIGGTFYVKENDNLLNFVGLNNLDSISGDLYFYVNFQLSSLSGLDSLIYIGQSLKIIGNDYLLNFSGLDNLKAINGTLWISYNSNLISLAGIDSISAHSIGDLTVTYNSYLSECDVKSICEYLASPNGSVVINGNATGCNSQQEVWLACTAGMTEIEKDNELLLYPNPVKKELYFKVGNNSTVQKTTIYNQLGQRVFYKEHLDGKIDISSLRPGVYIVELVTGDVTRREKLIISR